MLDSLQPGSRQSPLCHRYSGTDGNQESSTIWLADIHDLFPGRVVITSVAAHRDQNMPTPLIVSIPHHLGREEATRRLKAGLTRAASSIPMLHVDEERWEESRMIYRVRALGQAVWGHLDVADDHVRLEMTLPWLLQRFAEAAQAAIQHRGKRLLTKRG
jgi:hypothetical protein